MRRVAFLLVVLVSAFALVAAGCGGEQSQTASPETVSGETPTTESTTTETTTTESESTTTETTGTETTTTETSGGLTGDPAAGKTVFLGSAACGGCHTLSDAGSGGTVGPNLDDLKPTEEQVANQVTNGGGAMPAFKDTLTPQQIADVAAYVSSVAGK